MPGEATGGASTTVDPLAQARRDREALERFRQMQSGPPAELFGIQGALVSRGDVASAQRANAAERQQRRGTQLLEAGRLTAAITALRKATELDPRNAVAHHMLGRALLDSERDADAAAALRVAITLKDDFAAAHRDLAVALDRQGLDLEAAAAYREAVRWDPQWAEGHRRLGEYFELGGDLEEAARAFRHAMAAAPGSEMGRLCGIAALMLEGAYGRAEAELRHAILLDPDNDELHKSLGDVLSKQGRFEEAIAACDRALAINPLQVPAHEIAVHAKRCTETDRPRLNQMLAILDDPRIDDADRVFVHLAIGKLLDDLGQYHDAMRHFDDANGIKRRTMTFDRNSSSSQIDRLVQCFTPTFFSANAGLAIDDETPLLIVGMPRSGTTLVEQILSKHPQIAAGGELVFWAKRAGALGISSASYLTAEAARNLATDYRALLRGIAPAAARVTDKMPFNLFHLGLIHLLLPKARIIHCRRHPVDTCLSMYSTHFKARFEFACDKSDLAFAYRQYLRLMDHWRAVLPSDRFFELDYETLIADREAVTKRLVAFTGLDWHDTCLTPEANRRMVATSSLWQVRQPVYTSSIGRWRHYEPWLGELRQLLPEAERGQPRPACGQSTEPTA